MRPYLDFKREGGSNPLATAVWNWAVIFALLWVAKPFILMIMPPPVAVALHLRGPIVASEAFSGAAPTLEGSRMVAGIGVPTLGPSEFAGTAIAAVDATKQAMGTAIGATSTALPAPTGTAVLKRDPVLLKLSFYDPNIARQFKGTEIYENLAHTNCANYDFVSDACLSRMADGSVFEVNYGKAVACPPPMQNGDVLDVTYPEALKGRWTCRDRGWAIEKGYVDFLLRYPDMIWTGYNLNNFPWGSTVQAEWVHP